VVAKVDRGADGVRFESVASFVYALDRIAPTGSWGPVTVDIAYGGAFYAFLGRDFDGPSTSSVRRCAPIVDAGEAEIALAAAKAIPIEHPSEPDLAFLYGTILTTVVTERVSPGRNVCIFRHADDRSRPAGLSARMACRWRCGSPIGAGDSSGSSRAPVRELHGYRCSSPGKGPAPEGCARVWGTLRRGAPFEVGWHCASITVRRLMFPPFAMRTDPLRDGISR
jgi:hypothetical protein